MEAGGRVSQQGSFHNFNKTASPSGVEPRGIRRSSLDLVVCIIVEVNNRRGASVTAFGLYGSRDIIYIPWSLCIVFYYRYVKQ